MKPNIRISVWAVPALSFISGLTSRQSARVRWWLCLAALACLPVLSAVALDDSAAVKKLFAKPPCEYSSAPLWVWNDMLTEDQIRSTMRDLAGQQVKQVFVHPRPGLMTPYLSPEWFRLWRVALDEAEKLDMNVWIYDENSYPSGFAGGFVPEEMPESRGRGLELREVKSAPAWKNSLVAVYRLTGQGAENISDQVKAGTAQPEGRYLAASVVRAGNSPWHGNRCYVDLLYPGVTEKFLAVTMDAYKREIGQHFGKRVPGVFTDEPNIRPAGGLPWTDDLPQQFEKRWGYSLLGHLASLAQPVGDWPRVRHNYFQLLNELYIARWAKPYHDYCAKNNLEFTGHYWDHEWPNCLGVPDNMAMYEWHQRPAIDILMNQYQENTHAQFGNARILRELSSVANQLGLRRTLCEAYGAGGWDLRFEDMKRIGDWLYVLGVNTMDQHLSYVTLRGARKRDHPQSFSYHEPWWPAYHVSASYFERLTAALSHGDQVNPFLVIEPTTSAYVHNFAGGGDAQLAPLGQSFSQLLMELEKDQVEYDLGCEEIIKNHGDVRVAAKRGNDNGARFIVGKRSYSAVVIPAYCENLNGQTMNLLEKFIQAGGSVLNVGAPPARVDGQLSDRGQKAAQRPEWKSVKPGELASLLARESSQAGFAIQRAEGDQGILFHNRRQMQDGELLFLVNTSIEHESAGAIQSGARGVEQWNLDTGKTTAYPFSKQDKGVQFKFKLPPSGSLLVFLTKKSLPPVPEPKEIVQVISPAAPPQIERKEPNVLVVDYVDVTAGGETRTNVYFYRANQFAWQKNGMERDPWDSAVQFKDELIRKKFPAASGFTANYRFAIEGPVPANLAIVIERPDLYAITCNGQPVSAKAGDWWLDKVFGKIAIASAARAGENVVTIKAAPFTMYHELEAAYVLGNFSLKPSGKGFVIAPEAPLEIAKRKDNSADQKKADAIGRVGGRPGWNGQGHPFYSAGVIYREQFDVPKTKGRYQVSLPSWHGAVAQVTVNGKPAGYIASPPWECDVTSSLKPGQNTIEVLVIGTLKNTLGPHHAGPGIGSAWPGMFQQGPESGPPPGAQYATVGYGLFEPFVLKHASRE